MNIIIVTSEGLWPELSIGLDDFECVRNKLYKHHTSHTAIEAIGGLNLPGAGGFAPIWKYLDMVFGYLDMALSTISFSFSSAAVCLDVVFGYLDMAFIDYFIFIF